MMPPGGKVVLSCQASTFPQICTQELDTGELAQVTDELPFDEIGDPTWSPDGQQIVFDARPGHGGPQLDSHLLHITYADGNDLRQLVNGNTSRHMICRRDRSADSRRRRRDIPL
ncbi:MAG: TolB family protein [Anaerolineae bacterium]